MGVSFEDKFRCSLQLVLPLCTTPSPECGDADRWWCACCSAIAADAADTEAGDPATAEADDDDCRGFRPLMRETFLGAEGAADAPSDETASCICFWWCSTIPWCWWWRGRESPPPPPPELLSLPC